MRLSIRVDESTLPSLIGEYDSIVVGSDQVWDLGSAATCILSRVREL